MAEDKRQKAGKILVTGSGGMLGTDLCQELSGDYDIVGLDHKAPKTLRASGFTEMRCDITDRNKTADFIASAGPEVVIHAAAWTDVDGCEFDPDKANRVNAEGTENIAFACSKINALPIYISTDYVFDGEKKGPYNEKDLPNPLSVYGRSKYEGEKKIAALENYIIIRSSWLFGKNGKNFVSAILDTAKNKTKIEVIDNQKGCPTYTKDLAKAINKLLYAIRNTPALPARLSAKPRAGRQYAIRDIFHISNKGVVSWFDYAREILKLVNLDAEVVPIKNDRCKWPAPRPANSALDITKFENFTGFRMRDWREALREYLVG